MPERREANGSMYETVALHTETLEEHDARIREQQREIIRLKQADEDKTQEIKSMKTDFTNLENTIWKTAQSTQDVMKTTTDRLWDMLGTRAANQHEIQKTKLTSFWEFAGKLTMAGGLLAVAIEFIFGK